MGKINVLSFAVANLIAAGEVVDRPASVIKELMENAIDAGSTRITIEIQNGGVTFMRVSDNGCGMTTEDLPIAVRRHATSKIHDAEDLDGILTLGFRGEALAAIASVSHLRIFSKTADASMGAVLEATGGEQVTVTEQGCSDGTTVIVEHLFANVPARRKFLKKDATEAMAVTANVEKVALSRPDIAFRLIVDGNIRLETAGDGDLRHTVYAIFGKEFASRLIAVDTGEEEGIRVSGFIGRSDNVKANRNFQNYFINGRYVKSKTACAAVEQAYCSYMPPEKFPCCVLNLHINPAAVDVNVHPAKLEVKFSNERPVFEAIYYAVRNALEQDQQHPDVKLNQGHISVEQARRLFRENSPTHKPRVSDATVPIRDGRAESLQKQQMKMEIPAATLSQKPATVTASECPKPTATAISSFSSVGMPGIPRPVSLQTEPEKASSHKTNRDSFNAPLPSEPFPEGKNAATSSAGAPAVKDFPTPEEMLSRYLRSYEEGKIITPSMAEAIAEEEKAIPFAENSELGLMPVKLDDSVHQEVTSAATPSAVLDQSSACEVSVATAKLSTAGSVGASPKESSQTSTPYYRIIGEVWNAYILLECEDKLLLIDQHAAHERILFEQFKAAMHEREPLSQMLMLPVEFEFTAEDVQILSDYRAEIESIGFVYEIEEKLIRVLGIPCGIEPVVVADMFAIMADRIRNDTGSAQLTRDIMFEKALYQASCKAAIKAGRVYAPEHIAWICDQLMRIPDITVCPHGRPVAMELSRANLDHQFQRS